MTKFKLKTVLIMIAIFTVAVVLVLTFIKFKPYGSADIVSTGPLSVVFTNDTTKFKFDPQVLSTNSADNTLALKKPTLTKTQMLKPENKFMGMIWQATKDEVVSSSLSDYVNYVSDGISTDDPQKALADTSSDNSFVRGPYGQIWYSVSQPAVPENAIPGSIYIYAAARYLGTGYAGSAIGLNTCGIVEGYAQCQTNANPSGYFNPTTSQQVNWTPEFVNNSSNKFYVGFIASEDETFRGPIISRVVPYVSYQVLADAYQTPGAIELTDTNLIDSTTPASTWKGVNIGGIDTAKHKIPAGTSVDLKICAGDDRASLTSCQTKNITALPTAGIDFAAPAVGRYAKFSLILNASATETPVMPLSYYTINLESNIPVFSSFTPQVALTDTTVTVTGKNLGTTKQPVSFVETQGKYFGDEFPDPVTNPPTEVPVPNIVSWSPTQVVLKVPAGLKNDMGYSIKTIVSGAEARIGLFWLAQTAGSCTTKLTSVNKSQVKAGDEITITGTNLGAQADSMVSFYQIGSDSIAADITAWSTTSFKVKVPIGLFRARPFAFNIKLTNRNDCVSTIGPVITDPSGAGACLIKINNVDPYSTDKKITLVSDLGKIKVYGYGFGDKKTIKLASAPAAAANDLTSATTWSAPDATGNQTIETTIPEGLSPTYLYKIIYTNAAGCSWSIGPFKISGKIWTGNGTTNNWSEGKNWLANVAPSIDPAAPDNVYFLGTSSGLYPNGNKNCTVDTDAVAGRMEIRAYTSTNTSTGTITVGAHKMTNRKLVFNASTATIDATESSYTTDDFILNNGKFKAPKNTCSASAGAGSCLFLTANSIVTPTFQVDAAAKFIHNKGEVLFVSDKVHKRIVKIVANAGNTDNPTNSFYNLGIIKTNASAIASALDLGLVSLKVQNNFTVQNAVSDYAKKLTINNIKADTKNLSFMGVMPAVFGNTASYVWVRGDFENKIGMYNLGFLAGIEFIDNTLASNIKDQTYFEGDFKVATAKKTLVFESQKANIMKKNFIVSLLGSPSVDDYIILKGSLTGMCPLNEQACSCQIDKDLIPLTYCSQWAFSTPKNKAIVKNTVISDSYYLPSDLNGNAILEEGTEWPIEATYSKDECNNTNWQVYEGAKP